MNWNYIRLLPIILFTTTIITTEISDIRPWGAYEVIAASPTYKIKRITVLPHKRLSLQRHQHRAEHWYIIQGTGIATRNNETFTLTTGHSITIDKQDIHRIENCCEEPLIFIEIQTGDYFGEDDIERLADDFGRTS